MSKINVLATGPTGLIRTKTALKQLISTSAEQVRFVPVPVLSDPAHESVRGAIQNIPAGTVVTVLSPANGRQWSAQVSQTGSGVFTVR